jgi:integrase
VRLERTAEVYRWGLNTASNDTLVEKFGVDDDMWEGALSLQRQSEVLAFYTERRRIAYKPGNPRIMKIGLHTFRHWKATMLQYHETHDIIFVKEFLGQKNSGHNAALCTS